MSSNENKEKPSKFHEEVELIASNPKIPNSTTDSSIVIEVNSKENISNKSSYNSSTNTVISSINLLFGRPLNKSNPRKIGSLNAFLYINNYPLIVIGPHCKYIFYNIQKDLYSIFVLLFIIFLYFIISFLFFHNNYNSIILTEKISFYSYLIVFLICFLINPGIPERNYYSKKFIKEYKGDLAQCKKCDKCNIIIPKSLKVGHCIYCNICIKNYDHHCPWIGKCVGRYTKFPFYLFLLFSLFYIFSSILTFVIYMRINF